MRIFVFFSFQFETPVFLQPYRDAIEKNDENTQLKKETKTEEVVYDDLSHQIGLCQLCKHAK